MNSFITHKTIKTLLTILLAALAPLSLQAMQKPTIAIWLLAGHNDNCGKLFLDKNKVTNCVGFKIKTGAYYKFFAKKTTQLKKNMQKIELNAIDCDDSQNNNLYDQNTYKHLAKIANFIKMQITKTENSKKIHYFFTYNNSRATNAIRLLIQLLGNSDTIKLNTNNTGFSEQKIQERITQSLTLVNFKIPKNAPIACFKHINIMLTDEDDQMLDDDTSEFFTVSFQHAPDGIESCNLSRKDVCDKLNVQYPAPPRSGCFGSAPNEDDLNEFTVAGTVEILGNLISQEK